MPAHDPTAGTLATASSAFSVSTSKADTEHGDIETRKTPGGSEGREKNQERSHQNRRQRDCTTLHNDDRAALREAAVTARLLEPTPSFGLGPEIDEED
ncbi:hypothetical protein SLA2020_340370 [Shorea laevis]